MTPSARVLADRTATSALYTYLNCPGCGQGISEPFSIRSGPVPFVHSHGRKRCRLIINPDSSGNDQHRIWAVPHDMSLEEALTRVLRGALRFFVGGRST